MNRNLHYLLLVILSLTFTSSLYADVITLTNGAKIKCVVIVKDKKALLADTEFGGMTLNLKSVADIKTEDQETNFILRGDFFAKKGKYEDAMRFYGEAMLANPKSQVAQKKYNDLKKSIDAVDKAQLEAIAKQATEEPKITQDDVDAAQAKKKLGDKAMVSLQAKGIGIFPPIAPKGTTKEKFAMDAAKLDAMKKIFPDGYGIGFETSGDKIKIYPDGEIPRCKIEITEKQKYDDGYSITIQVIGPAESLMVNLPEDHPIIEVMGNTADIKGATQQEVQQRAIRDAVERAVRQMVQQKKKEDPKNVKKKYTGRAFPVGITNPHLTSDGYSMQVRLKIWFDPSS